MPVILPFDGQHMHISYNPHVYIIQLTCIYHTTHMCISYNPHVYIIQSTSTGGVKGESWKDLRLLYVDTSTTLVPSAPQCCVCILVSAGQEGGESSCSSGWHPGSHSLDRIQLHCPVMSDTSSLQRLPRLTSPLQHRSVGLFTSSSGRLCFRDMREAVTIEPP